MAPSQEPNKLKYQKIFNDLLSGIREGGYRANSKLPAERELAVKYGVARATARRALSDLAAIGLAVKRGRHGTLVLPGTHGSGVEILNLICSAEPLAHVDDFLRHGVHAAQKQGWGIKISRVATADEVGIRRALTLGIRNIFLAEGFEMGLDKKVLNAVSSVADHTVVLATPLADLGIPSVVGDDRRGITMAIDHLRSLGHRKIALIAGGEMLGHPILSVLRQQWKKQLNLCMTAQELRECVVRVTHEPFEDLALKTREVVATFLGCPAAQGVTAFLCLYEEIAVGTMAACRDAGVLVPDHASVMAYGVTERGILENPPLSGITVQMERHVAAAVEILKMPTKRAAQHHLLREIPPLLVRGGTLGPARRT